MTPPSLPPRYFWRRVAAFLVDYCLASLVALVLLLPFLGNTDRIRLGDGVIKLSLCRSVDRIDADIAAFIAPKRPHTAQVCDMWFNGVYDGRTLTVVYDLEQTEHSTFSRSLSVPVNKDGELVDPAYPQPALAAAILWIGAALMIARFAFSPGKRLFGLRVVPKDGFTGGAEDRSISRGLAISREGMKLAPFLLINIATYMVGFGTIRTQIGFVTWLTDHWVWPVSVGLLSAIGLILLYLVPLIRWRGAMPYDRRLGLWVVGPKKPPKLPNTLSFDGR